MAAVEERLSAYDALRAGLPTRIAALRARATVVSGLIADRQGEGYRTTDNDPAPHAAEDAARQVEALAGQQRFGDAGVAVERADTDLAAHESWAHRPGRLPGRTGEGHRRARTRAVGLDRAIADATWRPSDQPERNSAPPARMATMLMATMATPVRRPERARAPGAGTTAAAGTGSVAIVASAACGSAAAARCGRRLGGSASGSGRPGLGGLGLGGPGSGSAGRRRPVGLGSAARAQGGDGIGGHRWFSSDFSGPRHGRGPPAYRRRREAAPDGPARCSPDADRCVTRPAAADYRIRYVRTETHEPRTPSPRPVASTITAVSRPSVPELERQDVEEAHHGLLTAGPRRGPAAPA